MSPLTIYQDEDGYWLRNERGDEVAGPYATYQDADDVRSREYEPEPPESWFDDGRDFTPPYEP